MLQTTPKFYFVLLFLLRTACLFCSQLMGMSLSGKGQTTSSLTGWKQAVMLYITTDVAASLFDVTECLSCHFSASENCVNNIGLKLVPSNV